MATTLLLAPPSGGKTTRCIERIRQTLHAQPLATVRVVLPDRLQLTAFRRRLAHHGGALGVRVGTFGDLYRAILLQADRPIPLATDPVRNRLLRDAIQALQQQGDLSFYAPIAHTPGFLTAIRDTIAELKRALIFPEVFLEHVRDLQPGLAEIGRLYLRYQTQLQTLGWADSEGLNWLATEALEADPDLCRDWPLLVVDGFDSFYASQLGALHLLGDRIQQLVVTLPGDPDHERAAHRRFRRSLEQIQAMIPDAILEGIADSPSLPPGLAHLERQLFEPPPPKRALPESLTLLECRSPRAEAREALRWIKARHLREGVPLEACALVTPAPETYRPLLQEAAREFGLPLRFTHGEPLSETPPVATLLDLLELPLQGWTRRLTLAAIRTPYFDLAPFGLTPEDTRLFDDVSHYGQVIEGLDQWTEALDRLAAAPEPGEVNLDEDLHLPHLPRGDQATRLRECLLALANRLQPPERDTTSGWVAWLEDLLEALRFYERCETPLDRAAASRLRDALRALVLAGQVAGEAPPDYDRFVSALRATLEATEVMPHLDWRQPQVLVLRVLEARGLRFQAVAVLGLSEGLFPEVEREDPFLGEGLRAELGLEPRLGREQGGLFYQAATRADRALLLTRPYLAEGGEPWEPSPFWNAVVHIFDGNPGRIQPEAPHPLAEAASTQELLFWALRRGALPKSYAAVVGERWARLQSGAEVLRARLASAAAGPFEGDLTPMQESLQQIYGRQHVWSASRLEQYKTCPLFFLSASLLELERREPPALGLDAAQLGTLLHAILEQAYQAADDPADPEQVVAALQPIAAREFGVAPEKYGFRPTPLYAMECEAWLNALEATVRRLAEENGGWVPVAYEQRFGLGGVPPLALELDDERVLVRGLIDRVDRNSHGQIRIIDYKTGSSHLNSRDLYAGRRLQLPIYALGAQHAAGLGEPVEGFYWAILAAKRGSLRLSSLRAEVDGEVLRGPEVAYALVRRHVAEVVDGVRAGRFPPRPPVDGCPPYCPAVDWCWRYRAR